MSGVHGNDGPQLPDYIRGRLSLIIPPEIEKPIRISRRTGALRTLGALKNFVELPLDVIFETLGHLDPQDLLNLARVNIEFRALLLSRTSRPMWRNVLKGEPELPECPQDLSEPEYASLLYEKFCMACGSSHGKIRTDFALRLRMCVSCTKENIVDGNALLRAFGFEGASILMPLIPTAGWNLEDSDGPVDFEGDVGSAYNGQHSGYFAPEVDIVWQHLYTFFQTNQLDSEFDAWRAVLSENATRMMQEGHALLQWAYNKSMSKDSDELLVTQTRHEKILEEMLALGWEERYFPRDDDSQEYHRWTKYMSQPKEFNSRGWKQVLPKMRQIYELSKISHQKDDLFDRISNRYLEYRDAQPTEARWSLPSWPDVIQFEDVKEHIDIMYASCGNQELEYLLHVVTTNIPVFIEEAQGILLTVVQRHHPGAVVDVLRKARILFNCDCDFCTEFSTDGYTLRPYPQIIEHTVMVASPLARFFYSGLSLKLDKDADSAAVNIHTALGLDPDCRRDEIQAVGDKFTCGCDHHLYRGPLSYDDLLHHITRELQWFKRTADSASDRARRNGFYSIFKNTHGASALPTLIRVATANDEVAPHPPVTQNTDVPDNRFCRYCYCLTYQMDAIRNEMAAYHLKWKHGIEAGTVNNDFLDITTLQLSYGNRYNPRNH